MKIINLEHALQIAEESIDYDADSTSSMALDFFVNLYKVKQEPVCFAYENILDIESDITNFITSRVMKDNHVIALYTEPPPIVKQKHLSQDNYEFDKPDQNLIKKVREAVEFNINGSPIKDAITDDEIIDALFLLVHIADFIGEK